MRVSPFTGWRNAGRNGGEHYTPRTLIRAVTTVVKPELGETIYDGACGSAGFLCDAFDYLRETFPERTMKQSFLDFVLAHYADVGVTELDEEKLPPLATADGPLDPAVLGNWTLS